jgi:hypothetical protein
MQLGERAWRTTEVGIPLTELSLAHAFDELVTMVAERNFDFYDAVDGNVVKIGGGKAKTAKPTEDDGPSLDDVIVSDNDEPAVDGSDDAYSP